MIEQEVEVIEKDGFIFATVIRARKSPEGSRFYTDNSSQFQVGVHTKSSGSHTKPHYYIREKVFLENPCQEIFYVESGRLKMIIYDKDNKHVVVEKELGAGDLMILSGLTAHGVYFIEDTRLIEIKQGPYQAEQKVVVE